MPDPAQASSRGNGFARGAVGVHPDPGGAAEVHQQALDPDPLGRPLHDGIQLGLSGAQGDHILRGRPALYKMLSKLYGAPAC